jgi:hypothetical protein
MCQRFCGIRRSLGTSVDIHWMMVPVIIIIVIIIIIIIIVIVLSFG